MNYFAHAWLAAARSQDLRFLLGAMLPDWIRWIGARPTRALPAPLEAGIRFHHRTDTAFHAAPRFLVLVGDARAQLAAAGLARGPARAAAHVGIELLLDGALYHASPPETLGAYQGALAEAADATQGLGWSRPDGPARLGRVVRRLRQEDPVPGYRDPERVAAALLRTLEARRRLRIEARQLPAVARWAHAARARVEAGAEALLAQTEAGLVAPT